MTSSHAIPMRLTVLIAGAFFMEFLDGTIITTALPQMAHSLHASAVQMNIGITAYLLTLAVLVPVSGWIADRFGARTVFSTALGVFTCASVLCGLSRTLPVFTLMRVLQGAGGALMVPVGRLILLRTTPPERLTEAIVYTQWPGLTALVIGPALGGFITTYTSWRWIFFLNVPIGILAVVLALLWIENAAPEHHSRFDLLSFLLLACASTGLVYAMETGADLGRWPRTLTVLGISLFCGVAAIAAARRRPETSLIDLRSLQRSTFSQAVYGATAFRIAVSALPFLLPLMFQITFHLSAFRAGLYLLALFAGDMSMKAIVIPVLRRWGFRSVMLVNGFCTTLTLALCATLTPRSSVVLLVLLLASHGAFRSLEFTCMGTLAFTEIPSREMSRANGFLSSVMQLGVGMGVPVATITLRLSAHLSGDSTSLPALRDFHAAILVAAALSLGPVLNSLFLAHDAGARTSGHQIATATDARTV